MSHTTNIYSVLNPAVYKTKYAASDVIDDLKKYMYTKDNIYLFEKNPEKHSPQLISNSPKITILSSVSDQNNYAPDVPSTTNIPITSHGECAATKPDVYAKPTNNGVRMHTSSDQSLFWSVFIATKGYGEYLREQRRAANVWIEERLKIVDHLKKTPRQLKESNHKLTLESIQALFSSMLTSRQDREEDAILYAAYYNIPIVILHEKTAVVFDNESNRWSGPTDGKEEKQKAIYLEARSTKRIGPNKKQVHQYVLVESNSVDMTNRYIVENLGSGLRGVSTYKTEELRELATKYAQIDVKGRTKPELYAELAKWVAIDRGYV